MKHFFLLPALVLSAYAEESLTIDQALNLAEQEELRRFLTEDIHIFRNERSLDLPISMARKASIFDGDYCLIEMSFPQEKGLPAITCCLICHPEGDRLRLVELIQAKEATEKCFTYTLKNRRITIKDLRGKYTRSLPLPEPPDESLFEGQVEIKPTQGITCEKERQEYVTAIKKRQSKWSKWSMTTEQLVATSTKVDFGEGRYHLLRSTDIAGGTHLPLVFIFTYVDFSCARDSPTLTVIGTYTGSRNTISRWTYYYGKDETFSIRDGGGKLIYHLDLRSRKRAVLPTYALPAAPPL